MKGLETLKKTSVLFKKKSYHEAFSSIYKRLHQKGILEI